MLKNTGRSTIGEKVLLLGNKGFVGRELEKYLKAQKFHVKGLSSQDIDLTHSSSVEALLPHIESSDYIVMPACITPSKGKGLDAFFKNILMGKHTCEALSKANKNPHVILFSSEAVYGYESALINENTATSSPDLYGAMHRAREQMFKETVKDTLGIIRPTLVYGPGDPHNSYGPNRFRREAFKDKTISLFGEGEDTRSHIFVEDLVKLTSLMLQNKSTGILNGAPPESISFMDLAKMIAQQFNTSIEIKTTQRMSPITYRAFDTSQCYKAFPGFTFKSLKEGLASVHKKMQEDPNA